ncbi:MAG TPA: sigma-70 family RNA polymerase sigma factor [Thermoanaerobaculia bacterium]|nr:sigma-70 family RNA polymerase sigma factor [Thermoanaerobaculia bacterium]
MSQPDHAPIPGTEREPLDQFLERIRPRIRRVFRNYDIPLEDAEDILQEALLEALRKWDTIQHLEAWLLGTLGFKCSHYWKRQRGDRVQAVDMPVLEELSPPQPPAQEREEVLLDLHSLMRGLGRKHRAALWLRFGLGMSTDEVARRLGYCPSSIRKLTARSMARLHRWANEDSEDPTS